MKSSLLVRITVLGTVLLALLLCCAACSGPSDPQPVGQPEGMWEENREENQREADPNDREPANLTIISAEPEGEAIGYLKDKVTETGVLGEDYPILSYYGPRSSENGQISAYHRGMDFDMPTGTALITPCDCIIKYTGYHEARGYWIVMYWGNGYYIVYQHLSKILVKDGMRLSRGNKVGYSGDTGASLMPHLHLEILQCDSGKDDVTDFNDDDLRINPYYFVFGNESAYAKP